MTGEAWFLIEPPGWVPVPAVAAADDMLDRRVVLGTEPGGFRADMRAVSAPYRPDPAADQEAAEQWGLVVDVVSEHDWYRSRIRHEPVPKSRYPAALVWVERRRPSPTGPADPDPEPDPDPGPDASVFARPGRPAAPPPRRPRAARDVADLTGRRVVVLQPDGPVHHRRAVSEQYLDRDGGDVCVTICSEHDWYRWAITREPPRAEPVPVYLVWVE